MVVLRHKSLGDAIEASFYLMHIFLCNAISSPRKWLHAITHQELPNSLNTLHAGKTTMLGFNANKQWM